MNDNKQASLSGTGTVLLEELLRLSNEMLQAADADNWRHVLEIDLVRTRLLSDIDLSLLPQYEVRTATGLVMTILRTNERLTHLTEMARGHCGAQLDQMKRAQQAARAYGDNTVLPALLSG
jgi:hypothetical protein